MEARGWVGSDNPSWKGGSKEWQQGKHGRDKDNLSWKQQRQRCWDRDKYICQHCGRHEEGWKPDCHHVSPYRISGTHGLDNLISLCRSCHKKEEASIKELWNGKTFGGNKRPSRPGCGVCGKSRGLLEGICNTCLRETVLIPKARNLREEGLTYEDIAGRLSKNVGTVWLWVNDERWNLSGGNSMARGPVF